MNNRSVSQKLSVVSYNFRGYSQGCTLLQELCNSNTYDLIYCQELWLVPDNMHKILKFNNNYVGYGVSAMEQAVEQGFLRGRPWGGTAILVKESLVKLCSEIHTFDRVVTLTIADIILINVYMPYDDLN